MERELSTKGLGRLEETSLSMILGGDLPVAQAQVYAGASSTQISAERHNQLIFGVYILGPGDALQIEWLYLRELTKRML